MTVARHRTMTYDDYRGTRHFVALDGLRGMAILLVFTAHPVYASFWSRFHGAAGVTLFFVLSGYLITTLLLREEERGQGIDLRRFYVRRLFRIYPMFFAVFAIYCVLILGLGMASDRRDEFAASVPYVLALFPEHLFFTGGELLPFTAAWSIGIEEKFYLVWPVVGFVLLARAGRWRGLFLVITAIGSVLVGTQVDFLSPYQHLAYGALAAVLLHERRSFDVLVRLGRPVLLGAVLLGTCVLQFATERVLIKDDLYWLSGISFTLLLIGLVVSDGPVSRFLGSAPMRFLGAISYVFYLVHNFALDAVEAVVPAEWGLPGSLLSSCVALAGAIVVSWVIHRRFEEPLRALGVRLSQRPSQGQPKMSGISGSPEHPGGTGEMPCPSALPSITPSRTP